VEGQRSEREAEPRAAVALAGRRHRGRRQGSLDSQVSMAQSLEAAPGDRSSPGPDPVSAD
jgi:hypothetical protein